MISRQTFFDRLRYGKHTFRAGDHVYAKRHINPDGTSGGWVAETALVESTCYIGPDAEVYEFAQVRDTASILDSASVSGFSTIAGNATLADWSMIEDGAIIQGSTYVGGTAIICGDSFIEYGHFNKNNTYHNNLHQVLKD